MIKICIYEDNKQMRESLCLLIESSNDFKLEASFGHCLDVVNDYKKNKPDVILMDIDMPGKTGIEGLIELRTAGFTDVKVVMLTVFDDNTNVFEAIKNGANGYLLKKTSPVQLLQYLKDAYEGGAPMTSSVATQVLNMFTDVYKQKNDNYNLSERERDVLKALVKGYSYKMIADELFISIDTVRSHIKKIYEKMHVNSKTEAVALAFRNNLH
ncbi:MAG: response regulator transcription factor [Bacteroidia bacterium]|jgi:DNA-binding NarL/FixJ family response regulator|nr:response regulator transcription factor [Bacteroidia bacterium]